MAVVPRAQTGVQQAGIPGVRVSSDAPAAAFGAIGKTEQAFQNLGENMLRAQEEEKRKADDIRVIDADRQATEALNEVMYGKVDGKGKVVQPGVIHRKGQAAFGAPEEFKPMYEKKLKEINSSLTSDQQDQFHNISQHRMTQLDTDLNQHVSNERKGYEETVYKSAIDTNLDDSVQNFQNPMRLADNLNKQAALIQQYGADNGLTKDVIDNQIAAARSKTNLGVVNRMLDIGSDMAAKQYFEANKDQFTREDLNTIEGKVLEGNRLGQAQRLGDQLETKYGGDLGMAIKAVGQMKDLDPKIREATESQLSRKNGFREAAEREQFENLSTKAANVIDSSNTWPPLPQSEWNQLPVATRSSLEAYADKKANGNPVKTDLPTYYDLKKMGGNPKTRETFLKVNLLDYKDRLSNEDFKGFVKDQMEARGGATTKLDGYLPPLAAVNSVLSSNGIDPTPKQGSDAAKQVANFHNMVNKETMALEQKLGRPATSDEIGVIARKKMVSVITEKGVLWDTKKRLFEVLPSEHIEDIVIEKNVEKDITEALIRQGIPATRENIRRIYLKDMGFGK